MSPDPAGKASQRWDYTFGLGAAEGADPAVTLLTAVLDWPTLTMTFTVAQFAAFGKGLEKSGIELTEVIRRPHAEETP
jgi:hypothetical protein